MNKIFICFLVVIVIVVTVIIYMSFDDDTEHFHFKTPPLSYDASSCERMCDNTNGCNSFYYDPITRQCWMNSYHKYGDMYYPYMNNTYWWSPARYRWGRYWGGHNQRPLANRKQK